MVSRTPQMQAAHNKGKMAKAAGLPRSEVDNIYPDTRQGTGRLTWSRAFRNEWLSGYDGRA